MGYLLPLSIRLRLPKSCVMAAHGAPDSCSALASSPKPVALASHFSCLKVTGFGFGVQITILEADGFSFVFLNFNMEATGFSLGLGFLSPSWLRLRLRSHQSGFQPNPGLLSIQDRRRAAPKVTSPSTLHEVRTAKLMGPLLRVAYAICCNTMESDRWGKVATHN